MEPSRHFADDDCNRHELFTVGHSSLDFEPFVGLLAVRRVDLLVDVRSRPHSSRFPQFSMPGLEHLLKAQGLRYLFLGEELGGRPDDLEAYRPDGLVDYRARRRSYAFRSGLERVLEELKSHTLALMCAEEDPLECHRFLMICPELVALGIQPLHIRKGSKIETQEAAENRLLALCGLGAVADNTLFPEDRGKALEEAFALQAARVAFRVDPQAVDRW
jgi:uncharacterized protein (DUF488 family)